MLPFQHDPQMLLEAGEVATEARQTRNRRAKHVKRVPTPRSEKPVTMMFKESERCRKCRAVTHVNILVHAYGENKYREVYPRRRPELCAQCAMDNYAARHPNAKWLQL